MLLYLSLIDNEEDKIKFEYIYNSYKKTMYYVANKIFSVGISKFSSTTWSLSTYGKSNDFLDDTIYTNMIEKELKSGIHTRPKEYPYFITQAYFHTPLELQQEIESVGFETIQKHAIEGLIWFTPCLEEKWNNANSKEQLLNILRITESEESVMGMSPHFMIVSRK